MVATKASKEPVGLCFAKSTADGTPAPTVGDDDVVSNKSVVPLTVAVKVCLNREAVLF